MARRMRAITMLAAPLVFLSWLIPFIVCTPSGAEEPTSVRVHDEVRAACAGELSQLHARDDHATLDALARCVTGGPLKGRVVLVVAHTDSNGEFEYAIARGAELASSVGRYLVERGVEASQIAETSRGQIDDTGTDGVDISLAP